MTYSDYLKALPNKSIELGENSVGNFFLLNRMMGKIYPHHAQLLNVKDFNELVLSNVWKHTYFEREGKIPSWMFPTLQKLHPSNFIKKGLDEFLKKEGITVKTIALYKKTNFLGSVDFEELMIKETDKVLSELKQLEKYVGKK